MGLVTRAAVIFRERLLVGLSWNILSAVATQGSVLISAIIVARILGLQSFGGYALLVSTVMTVAAVAQVGNGLAATKFVGEALSLDSARVARILALCRAVALVTGGVATLAVIGAADLLCGRVLGRPEMSPSMRLIAVATLFQILSIYQVGALQGFGAFKEMSRSGAVAGVAHVACTGIGAWTGELPGAVIGYVVASLVRAAAMGHALRTVRAENRIPATATPDPLDTRLIWRFAVPAGLAGLVTMPCLWAVSVLVARLPNGLELVAVFTVGHQLRLAVLQMPSLLNGVSFSVMSRMKGADDRQGFRGVFWSNLAANAVVASVVVALSVVLVDPLLRLYGPDFLFGRQLLILLLLSVLPEMLAMSFYQLIQSEGRMWQSLFAIALPRDLLYLALASALLPAFGITGAAGAYLLAHTVGACLTVGIARHKAPASLWKLRQP